MDEATLVIARRLFGQARTPAGLLALSRDRLEELVRGCAFHERKARQLAAIARRAVEVYRGELPGDREILLSFEGVGPKCAGLALGIACGQEYIGVDVHVHRVTNRWGYVRTAAPEQTMAALEQQLPSRYWLEINRLLVPFGKHICTGRLPRCSSCPVLEMCDQAGVERHR